MSTLDDDARRVLAKASTDDEELLTVKEYAERRRVHIQTVYSAIRRGKLKHRVERAAASSIRIAVPRFHVEA